MLHTTALRRVLLIGLLILLSIGQTGSVSAGINVWTSHGPEGGQICALAIDPATPTTLYAGTYGGGVFKSTNGGGNWSAVNTGLTDTLFVPWRLTRRRRPPSMRGQGGGVFKSTNGGGNWSAVNTGLTDTYVCPGD